MEEKKYGKHTRSSVYHILDLNVDVNLDFKSACITSLRADDRNFITMSDWALEKKITLDEVSDGLMGKEWLNFFFCCCFNSIQTCFFFVCGFSLAGSKHFPFAYLLVEASVPKFFFLSFFLFPIICTHFFYLPFPHCSFYPI